MARASSAAFFFFASSRARSKAEDTFGGGEAEADSPPALLLVLAAEPAPPILPESSDFAVTPPTVEAEAEAPDALVTLAVEPDMLADALLTPVTAGSVLRPTNGADGAVATEALVGVLNPDVP